MGLGVLGGRGAYRSPVAPAHLLKGDSFSIELLLYLCQNSVGHTPVGLLLGSLSVLLMYTSVSSPILHNLDYCSGLGNLNIG